ncbi:cysteine proteinase superfamily protein [Artemisia annua]|uniref:Cysteine proteinase superfamily protein n=1 Tax=Artemisia annua TaxID=35608 RepID=A0A2U1KLU6_ARTAN|nr:cysteine proteinase superfamily protein [Artemisia annua]
MSSDLVAAAKPYSQVVADSIELADLVSRHYPFIREPPFDLRMLLQRLKEYKYVRRQVGDDGNCFFRAVSHQLFNTEDYHMFIRAVAMAYMWLHPQDFYDPRRGSFEEFWNYTYRMSQFGEYAGEDMITATCESVRFCLSPFYFRANKVVGSVECEMAV